MECSSTKVFSMDSAVFEMLFKRVISDMKIIKIILNYNTQNTLFPFQYYFKQILIIIAFILQQHSSKSFVIPNASIPFDQFLQKILLVLAPVPRSQDTQTWILPPGSEISNIHPWTPTTTTQLPIFRLPATTRAPNTPHHFTDDAFRQKFQDALHKISKTAQSNANKNYINSSAFIRDDLPPDTRHITI